VAQGVDPEFKPQYHKKKKKKRVSAWYFFCVGLGKISQCKSNYCLLLKILELKNSWSNLQQAAMDLKTNVGFLFLNISILSDPSTSSQIPIFHLFNYLDIFL
jgi:hypothetical protein